MFVIIVLINLIRNCSRARITNITSFHSYDWYVLMMIIINHFKNYINFSVKENCENEYRNWKRETPTISDELIAKETASQNTLQTIELDSTPQSFTTQISMDDVYSHQNHTKTPKGSKTKYRYSKAEYV
jgi:hypothetical protein